MLTRLASPGKNARLPHVSNTNPGQPHVGVGFTGRLPTRARRRRALIGSSRVGRPPSCLRGAASSALIRPAH